MLNSDLLHYGVGFIVEIVLMKVWLRILFGSIPIALISAYMLGISPITIHSGLAAQAVAPQESFENAPATWQVSRDTAGSGSVSQVGTPVDIGIGAARLATSSSGSVAALSTTFSDAAGSHIWMERPGTYRWQNARIFVPAATVAQISAGQYLTLARFEATGTTSRWELSIRSAGQLYVVGTDQNNGQLREFPVYGVIPTDRWFDLEIGLHSQQGPGVKRAFAFLIDGTYYGWYHQGRMVSETYNRTALGIVDTTSTAALTVYVDQWYPATNGTFPAGPDLRDTAEFQTIDYRNQNGARWQIDWSTWEESLILHPTHGLYSANSRLQSGMNLDRAPNLNSGWGEIEIGWPNGTPTLNPNSYFGPMIGFRKEINREENFEIIPIGNGNGTVDLALEGWVGNPVIISRWPIPSATSAPTSHIPEPGDIIRTRWEQIDATNLHIQAWYYDASTAQWHAAIDTTINITAISDGTTTVNYTDGYHTASSVTIDSTQYSIRRYSAGTLASFPIDGGLLTSTPIPPSSTPTNTPDLSTATSTSTPSATAIGATTGPTDTALPATATNTPIPPTSTSTSTPIPPTSTSTSTPTGSGFPVTGVLDTFNRANGALGTGWGGSTGSYSITSNQLDVGTGGNIHWSGSVFGANQEAFVTLSTIDPNSAEIDLLLKSQSTTNYSPGVIEVWFKPSTKQVQVWTYSTAQGWVVRGSPIAAPFVAGDQFGARVNAAGLVSVYRNGVLLGTANVSAWTYAASGGAIGLWFDTSSNSLADNFGGGNAVIVAPTATPVPPTATSTPTTTPVPPTATPTATSVPPTATPTATSVPPTATNTSTATPVPPTATNTSTATSLPPDTSTPTATLVPPPDTSTPTATLVPPTATNTPTATLVPTATSVPPTATNTPTATRTPTATLAPNDAIFANGFENGNLGAWSSSAANSGNLTVSAAAALVGTRGMQALVANNVNMLVTDDTPNAESRYRARFYFDPNSITMGNNDAHYLFYGYTGTTTIVTRIEMRRSASTYQARAALLNNGTTWSTTNWFTISDAPHVLEIDWRAATSSTATNGGLTFWIDNVQQANLTGIANGSRRIDRVQLGLVAGVDTTTRGTEYFDAFVSRRTTYIGP